LLRVQVRVDKVQAHPEPVMRTAVSPFGSVSWMVTGVPLVGPVPLLPTVMV
jgi:hypothetical protein